MQAPRGTTPQLFAACRRVVVAGLALAAVSVSGVMYRPALPGEPEAAPSKPQGATYQVKVAAVSPPRLAVTAFLAIDGSALEMDTTRPGNIAELDAKGWPALVSNLRVFDMAGRPLETRSATEHGWQLAQPFKGRIRVTYDVDYSALSAKGWPAPREAAFADPENIAFVGRSAFITTPLVSQSIVQLVLPGGWRPVTPWIPQPGTIQTFIARSRTDLVENLVVVTRNAPEVISASGFHVLAVPMGPWIAARDEVRRVLEGAIPQLVKLIGFDGRENYLVVLLPMVEQGGESYRQSFALTVDQAPSAANSPAWGNTLAHEIFHYWNGWRLRGADYASTQWFQEGFTEYAANVSMVAAGLDTPEAFARRLADHVRNYRSLATTLEAIGTHKGPPLYSAGALVAFSWDVMIRDATGGKRSLSDFLRALWQQTQHGGRAYEWRDIQAALDATAPLDWEMFYRTYIRGDARLPLDKTFALAGLRLDDASDGMPRVAIDPAAPARAQAVWRGLVGGQ
jgi:predicted metalloprotease with PDZ domain